MDNNILLEKKLPYLFVHFVIPSIIAMVIAGAQGMVDGIFLGNFAGSDAMASVNIANPYLQIIIGCTMIVCTGTLSFLGRTLGENKPEKAKDIFRSSVVALLIISLILMFAGIIFYKNIAYMLGANEVLVKGTGQYFCTGNFFHAFVWIYRQIVGKTTFIFDCYGLFFNGKYRNGFSGRQDFKNGCERRGTGNGVFVFDGVAFRNKAGIVKEECSECF